MLVCVQDAKKHMKDVWEHSKTFRISDKIHMTEVQILHRLRNDGMFQWLDNNKGMVSKGIQNLHVCFYMRRWGLLMCACGLENHVSGIVIINVSMGWVSNLWFF